MIEIQVRKYYQSDFIEIADEAYEAGKAGEFFYHIGQDFDVIETFLITSVSIDGDILDILTSELEEEGDIELGERELSVDPDEQNEMKIYEVNIS